MPSSGRCRDIPTTSPEAASGRMTHVYPATFFSLPAIPPDSRMALWALIWLPFLTERTAGASRQLVKKPNDSKPLLAADGHAFPLPSTIVLRPVPSRTRYLNSAGVKLLDGRQMRGTGAISVAATKPLRTEISRLRSNPFQSALPSAAESAARFLGVALRPRSPSSDRSVRAAQTRPCPPRPTTRPGFRTRGVPKGNGSA
jgi:hypothetical protein